MKWNTSGLCRGDRIVTTFGRAALVQRADGKWQLRGGSRDDHTAATEWISLFMHEVVLTGAYESGARGRNPSCCPRIAAMVVPGAAPAR